MIEFGTETLVSFSEACNHLPRRRAGKKPHPATLYRWASVGLQGIKLETIQVGGTLCTSIEALQRYFDRLSEVNTREGPTTMTGNQQKPEAAPHLENRAVPFLLKSGENQ